MRDGLAERLLAEVLGWDAADVARERPVLQLLARLKYDEYQQFSPGMRFVESLALWLEQFSSEEERKIAYQFVKTRLIFISSAEMNHLVGVVYPNHIRRIQIQRAARAGGVPQFMVSKIVNSAEFKKLERATAFFGLSDGARVDIFRRANPELSHEQIFRYHELNEHRLRKLQGTMSNGISTIVLLDDFSASGKSYFRTDGNGEPTGKISKFIRELRTKEEWKAALTRDKEVHVIMALYVATERALAAMREGAGSLFGDGLSFQVLCAQTVSESVAVARQDAHISPIIEHYYDKSQEDRHMKVGKTDDYRYGFNACALPLVLHHNTPNNSLYILWAPDDAATTGLFPRISRHK